MSRHIITDDRYSYAFGWDNMLQSYYFQKYDLTIEDEDDRIVVWLGADADTIMYFVKDLIREAKKNGLKIDYRTRVKLYGERDDGR